MRIAICQSHIIWENKVKNTEALREQLAEVTKERIDLLLLPEMSFTGFSMNTSVTADGNRETVKSVSQLASEYHIAIGVGWVKRYGDIHANCYSVIDRSGRSICEYAKMHPFFSEQASITPGKELGEFSLSGITFSVAICYDLRFPEIFRAASSKCHVMIVPANWPSNRREHWMALLKARAIENQVYMIGINCVGNIGGTDYSGDSCVIAPDGEVRLIETGKEGLFVYDLEDDVDKYRESFPVLKNSRWYFYSKLYGEI